MDDTVKNNKTRKRRAAPAAPAQPLEIGNATATVAGEFGGEPPAAAANQSHHETTPAGPAQEAASPAVNAPAEEQAPGKKTKSAKPRLVRGSFALSEDDHAMLADLKKACQQEGIAIKKSELLRVAIGLLRQVDTASLAHIIASLPPTKRAKDRKGK